MLGVGQTRLPLHRSLQSPPAVRPQVAVAAAAAAVVRTSKEVVLLEARSVAGEFDAVALRSGVSVGMRAFADQYLKLENSKRHDSLC